ASHVKHRTMKRALDHVTVKKAVRKHSECVRADVVRSEDFIVHLVERDALLAQFDAERLTFVEPRCGAGTCPSLCCRHGSSSIEPESGHHRFPGTHIRLTGNLTPIVGSRGQSAADCANVLVGHTV